MTDAILGTVFGLAAARILRTIGQESEGRPIPVLVGGGMAKSLDLFLPYAQSLLKESGIQSDINPSHFLATGGNANLYGALMYATATSRAAASPGAEPDCRRPRPGT